MTFELSSGAVFAGLPRTQVTCDHPVVFGLSPSETESQNPPLYERPFFGISTLITRKIFVQIKASRKIAKQFWDTPSLFVTTLVTTPPGDGGWNLR
jgi:hypothetical protein